LVVPRSIPIILLIVFPRNTLVYQICTHQFRQGTYHRRWWYNKAEEYKILSYMAD